MPFLDARRAFRGWRAGDDAATIAKGARALRREQNRVAFRSCPNGEAVDFVEKKPADRAGGEIVRLIRRSDVQRTARKELV